MHTVEYLRPMLCQSLFLADKVALADLHRVAVLVLLITVLDIALLFLQDKAVLASIRKWGMYVLQKRTLAMLIMQAGIAAQVDTHKWSRFASLIDFSR